MNPIVVGGNGFIGLNVVRALGRRGLSVRATRRPTSNTIFLRKEKAVERVEATLEDRSSLERAMDGRDVVFFAATPYPRDSLQTAEQVARAVAGVANAVEAAMTTGVRRFVFTSSVATIGPPGRGRALATEDDVLGRPPPGSTYHAMKLATETVIRGAVDRGLPAVVLCPTGCLGELDAKAGTGFFLLALASRSLPFWVDGPVNMVDVEDVAEAHVEAALRGRVGERYILGGHNTTVRDLFETAAHELDVPMPSPRLPIPVARALSTLAEVRARVSRGGQRARIAREFIDMIRLGRHVDSSKAVRELDLRCTDLAVTVRKACRWFERNRYIKRGRKAWQPSVQPT